MWLILLIIVLVSLVYYKLQKIYNYWYENGVIYEQPKFIFGNMNPNIFEMGAVKDMVERIYKKFANHRYVGVYQYVKPTLLIRDLELIKQITVKDFDYFADHITFMPTDIDPLWKKNLFQMSVKDGWQDMRSTLSPSFTSSKMKMMFELMKDCSNQFIGFLKEQDTTYTFDVKDFFTKFANDVIGTCAFGVTSDSLKNPNNEFFEMGKEATDIRGLKIIKFLAYLISPTLIKMLGIKIFNENIGSFFKKIIKNSIDYRREKNIVRPDMIHLLLEAQNTQDKDTHSKKLLEGSYESITAQALVFFTAGFESASSAMTFLAYDLAYNVNVQNKLYKEISEVLSGGKELTYETLLEMKYLDCVVSEKLLQLEEGMLIWIPAIAIQNDEKYFSNPSKFDPDRFNTENKPNIAPYSYIPFGAGPRVCLGSRFALMEMKLIIVEIIRNFKIMTSIFTEDPLKSSKTNFRGIPDNGVLLTIKPRLQRQTLQRNCKKLTMFWGLTPALDLQEEIRENGKCPEEINILIVGGQDCRHVIKTLACKYKHEPVKITFYIMEAILETISKQLLLLNIALQSKDISLIQKTRYFMETYGNTLVRPVVAKYLKAKAVNLIDMITNYERMKDVMPYVELDLKFKERDYLENVFKFWCSADEFDVQTSWDNRLRKHLGARYDSKMGAFDWDLNMRFHNVGGKQVCNQEYKHFRATGIAFTWLESEVSKSNRTFVCCVIPNGKNYAHYGYLGEMQTGPYVAYGLTCDDVNFLKTTNGVNSHRSTDVTERNLLQYFYEIENNKEYEHTKVNDLNLGASTFVLSENKVVDYGAAGDVTIIKNHPCINLENVKIKFVSLSKLITMKHKAEYHNFFSLIYYGSSYLKYFDSDIIDRISAPNSLLIIENQIFVLSSRDKQLEEFEQHVFEKVNSIKNLTAVPFNVKKHYYAKFVLKV
ncbi:hypothetical protein FQR65_LT01569 [Abscondita terminalis]|nr:hypothetical protein FQR65_LT01569 [Abscondita terminalis]